VAPLLLAHPVQCPPEVVRLSNVWRTTDVQQSNSWCRPTHLLACNLLSNLSGGSVSFEAPVPSDLCLQALCQFSLFPTYLLNLLRIQDVLVAWLSGRTSVSDWRTFQRSTCSWWVTTNVVHGYPGLFTDTSEHIRFYSVVFYFVVFLFSTVVVPCCRLIWLM